MICKECIKKDVCKHLVYLKEYEGLELKNCSYKANSYSTILKDDHVKDNVMLLNTSSKEDIMEKIQKISKDNSSVENNVLDFKVVSTPTELVECSTCNSKTYFEDLSTCSKCEKQICPVCGYQTYDCTSDQLVNLCDDCWNEKEE